MTDKILQFESKFAIASNLASEVRKALIKSGYSRNYTSTDNSRGYVVHDMDDSETVSAWVEDSDGETLRETEFRVSLTGLDIIEQYGGSIPTNIEKYFENPDPEEYDKLCGDEDPFMCVFCTEDREPIKYDDHPWPENWEEYLKRVSLGKEAMEIQFDTFVVYSSSFNNYVKELTDSVKNSLALENSVDTPTP